MKTIVDCSKVVSMKLSRPACLAMVASACEVFPKECMGTLCCLNVPVRKGRIVAAFPFQLAERQKYEVESDSYRFFHKMLGKGSPWKVIGSYHSHTSTRGYDCLCLPSDTDLENMEIGELEIIVRAVRCRKRPVNKWGTTEAGSISISWGKFQFLLRGFVRLEGFDKSNVPLYRTMKLELE